MSRDDKSRVFFWMNVKAESGIACLLLAFSSIVSEPAISSELILDGLSLNIPGGIKVIDSRAGDEMAFVYSDSRPARIISIRKIDDETEKMWGCEAEKMMRALFSDDAQPTPCPPKRVAWMKSVIVDGAEIDNGQLEGGREYYIACKPSNNCTLFVYGGGRKGGYMVLSNFLQLQGAKELVIKNEPQKER